MGITDQRDHAEGTEMKATSVYGLARNDLEGALLLRAESIAQGRWRVEDDHIILRLQDNAAALIKRIAHWDKKNRVIEVEGLLVLGDPGCFFDDDTDAGDRVAAPRARRRRWRRRQ
jgi:hypothetical protein